MDQEQPQTATTPVPSIVPPIQPPQSKSRVWMWILAGVLLLGVGTATGIYLGKQLYSKPALAPSPTPLAMATPSSDPTANWKTYTNDSEGISFKYPQEITLKISEKGLYWLDSSGSFQTNISWNSSPLAGTLEQELISRDECPKEVTNGIIPGPVLNSLRCDYDKSHYTSVSIWIANGRKIYKADIGAINPNVPVPQDDINLLNKILSTFKLTSKFETKQRNDGWTAYSNKDYGLSFSYPTEWDLSINTNNMFEAGDLVTASIVGPTQKPQSEFYDGASFTVAIPTSTSGSLDEWLNQKGFTATKNFEINKNVSLGGQPAVRAYGCGLGCFNYIFTKYKGNIYGIVQVSNGGKKLEYDQSLSKIVNSFKFLD